MGMLDHWHPVLLSRRLRDKPVGVTVAGAQVALFRTSNGQLAAVSDVCPHRRLKLSAGTVVGDRLRCRYHGWTFDACGNGESPAAPKMTACTTSYDVREAHGLVWLKSRDSAPTFPTIEANGFFPICTLEHIVPAPLELAVDNFNEIEHSGTVHDTFGYDLDRLNEVQVRFESTDNSVRVINCGPTKRINRLYASLIGIRRGDTFHDHWTTRFSPVHSVFDHWWTSADGKREAMVRWRLYIFFVPQDERDDTGLLRCVREVALPRPDRRVVYVPLAHAPRDRPRGERGRVDAVPHGRLRHRPRRAEVKSVRQGTRPHPRAASTGSTGAR